MPASPTEMGKKKKKKKKQARNGGRMHKMNKKKKKKKKNFFTEWPFLSPKEIDVFHESIRTNCTFQPISHTTAEPWEERREHSREG
jgi:type IV secretory pathway TraG/TraD family ATPase VirD4